MIVVGVTGKYCAGKSTVADLLADHGYETIDVDRLGHDALAREAQRVVARFGAEVTGDDGQIDRKALGRIVFSDDEKLHELEAIVHPTMVEMVSERVASFRISDEPPPGIVINAAILFRMNLHPLCDTVLYVTAPFLRIVRRAKQRDDASLFDVIRRLRSQRDVDPQHSRADADIHSVENDGDRDRLREHLAKLVPLP